MMSNDNATNSKNDLDDRQYREKYHRLREQHEIDKRVLLAQFHYQTNTLQQQHQHQLQEHLKMVLAHQREQQQIPPHQQLEGSNDLVFSIQNKEKKSAVASNAVKKHLQKFVIDRQKIKVMDNFSNLMTERSKSLRWTPSLDESRESRDTSNSYSSVIQSYDDFPLRKTASEPNLKVKSRLKQKLSADQRSSPLLTRRSEIKADLANRIKKKMSLDSGSDIAGQNLPESGSKIACSFKDARSSSVQPDIGLTDTCLSDADGPCDLYSSPSLPNISLALSQKQNDGVVYARNTPDWLYSSSDAHNSSPQASSWPACLGQLKEIEHARFSPLQKEFFTESLIFDDEVGKGSSHPGPIRSHQLRPHKTLSRTRSAPTTVSSQLQHHILQKKHQRMLQQQKKRNRELNSPEKDSTKRENDILWRSQNDLFSSKPKEASATHTVLNKSLFAPLLYLNNQDQETKMLKTLSDATELPTHFEKNFVNAASTKYKPVSPRDHITSKTGRRSLVRTQSSPATSFLKIPSVPKIYKFTTGIAYSHVMLKHGCACGDNHIEHPGRLEAIWKRILSAGFVSDGPNEIGQCEQIEPRKATTDELQLVHTQEHTLRYGTTSLARKELDLGSKFIVLPCGGVGVDNGIDVDTVWNELETINAARMAVGCTVDLAMHVAQKKLKNGFAVVRPPGHHAQKNLAMAFCYFNSVAVAARKLQSCFPTIYKKILIVDWDVHHCNGTQNIFYSDPSVLVVSVHRYDGGNFFPGTGALQEVGADEGQGFNVNIGFSDSLNPPLGDADYIAVFRCIVIPIAQQFQPDFVFVSSGFSAADGHSPALGGFKLSPNCFAFLTEQMLQLAEGKVVMALEGGFEINALCDCTELCVRALLGHDLGSVLSESALTKRPSPNTVKCMKDVLAIQMKHWKCLEETNIDLSYTEWLRKRHDDETCNAMALLSVQNRTKSTGVQEINLKLCEKQNPDKIPKRKEFTSIQEISQQSTEKESLVPQSMTVGCKNSDMVQIQHNDANLHTQNNV